MRLNVPIRAQSAPILIGGTRRGRGLVSECMRLLRSFLAAATTCALFGAGLYSLPAPAKAQELIGRSATLGGRKVQCNNAPIIVDYTLPSEGAADERVRDPQPRYAE